MNNSYITCIEQDSSIIQQLPNGAIVLDYGPTRMSILVYEYGKVLSPLAREGALYAIYLLKELSKFLPVIKSRSLEIDIQETFPEVLQRMVEATKALGEEDLTPLAAVAGTISEMVADFMFEKGGTKVLVDNGGDIAIRLREEEVARVGIKTEIEALRPTYLLTIDSTMGMEGVATSGFGGRSFTKGVASAATVLAKKASLADASATVIGNFTNIDDPNISRALAETIYPDTDIAGQWITTRVGQLPLKKVEEALKNGMDKALLLHHRGLIHGAFIALQGRAVWTDLLNPLISYL